MASAYVNENVKYEPDENPPRVVTIGSGLQAATVIVAPIVLTVVIVSRIADQADSYMSWAVFAALLVSGATTILQGRARGPVRIGPHPDDGHVGRVHRRLRRGPDRGWPVHDGEPRSSFRRCSSSPWRHGFRC